VAGGVAVGGADMGSFRQVSGHVHFFVFSLVVLDSTLLCVSAYGSLGIRSLHHDDSDAVRVG
jgi:hypothetical protein